MHLSQDQAKLRNYIVTIRNWKNNNKDNFKTLPCEVKTLHDDVRRQE